MNSGKNDLDSIQKLEYKTDNGLGSRANIGIIVLSSDQTLELEFRTLLDFDGVALYHARIPNEMEITEETLAKMEAELPITSSLLPGSFKFNVIGYGCTAGTTIIGEEQVANAIRTSHPGIPVSNPLTACKEALRALKLKRIAFLTPYAPTITQAMRDNLLANGFEIPVTASYYEADDFIVGRITSESILESIKKIGARDDCDGVFVSCTNLRAASTIEPAEAFLGKPVTSSNHALAWHLLRLAGINDSPANMGSLFQSQLI
ncbi:MAG: Maleate isomerase [Deltaproteobacteria bacterium]|jgi:maleate isomerase|nr:Maleate isomerase [Deltaproteobacteria bacterium]